MPDDPPLIFDAFAEADHILAGLAIHHPQLTDPATRTDVRWLRLAMASELDHRHRLESLPFVSRDGPRLVRDADHAGRLVLRLARQLGLREADVPALQEVRRRIVATPPARKRRESPPSKPKVPSADAEPIEEEAHRG